MSTQLDSEKQEFKETIEETVDSLKRLRGRIHDGLNDNEDKDNGESKGNGESKSKNGNGHNKQFPQGLSASMKLAKIQSEADALIRSLLNLDEELDMPPDEEVKHE